jgi:3-oxoacyl-[acyl-carrier-protein] synthase II
VSDVVITGIGLLTPLGVDADELSAALAAGRTGIAQHDDLRTGHTVAAGRIDQVPVKEIVRSPQLRRMDRLGKMATVAAGMALRHAGLGDGIGVPCERAAVGWATEYASLEHTWAFQERVRTRGPRLANPMSFPNLVQNAAAGYLSILFGLRGPSVTFCHHETCGLEALSWAARQLRRDRADLVLVGVSEELGEVLFRARSLIGVEAPPGEGAVALVLERRDAAVDRGARILATVAADSAAASPLPSHWYPSRDAAPRVLRLALERAGLSADELAAELGRARHLADAVGMSAVLPLFHVAALALAGEFPAATVVDARGGAARAVVLAGPERG